MTSTAPAIPENHARRHDDVCMLEAANAARSRSRSITRLSVLVSTHNQRWTVSRLMDRLLSTPASLELELVVVDDGSTDGSDSVVSQLAEKDPRIKPISLPRREGRGAAVRRAISEMTGDVVVLFDSAAGCDPHEMLRLLKPVLSGTADAVYGSRFRGGEQRVMPFLPTLGSRLLTFSLNAICNQGLTDCRTGYVAVRADILRQLKLTAKGTDIDAEVLCRLSQWGARIFEAPVGCSGGKASVSDRGFGAGLRAITRAVYARAWDNRFTAHTGMYVLRSCDKAGRYNQWLLRQVEQVLGPKLLEAGSGIGNLSQLLTEREELVLVDHDPLYVEMLHDRFALCENVTVRQTDLTEEGFERQWGAKSLDTILCSNVLEHLEPHEKVLAGFHRALEPGGHCVIIVPAEPKLYTGLDKALGHYRRYTEEGLTQLMSATGFEIIYSRQACKVGALAWLVNGRLLGKRSLTPRQMIWFDRFWPLLQRIDRFLPWRGMSLIVVGRKSVDSE